MRKIITAIVIAALVIPAVGVAAFAGQPEPAGLAAGEGNSVAGFQDVSETDWFALAVEYAVDNGLMQGVGGNRFDPAGTMTRAMFAAVLARMSGADLEEYKEGWRAEDVPADSWYHDYVSWAAREGIIEETERGFFHPQDPITRELAAKAMMRLHWFQADYMDFGWYDVDYDNIKKISDQASISEDTLEAVRWAMAVGLMQGDGTRFDPQGTLTRAQSAQILTNYHKKEKRVRQEAPWEVLDQTIKSGKKTYTIRIETYSRMDDARGNLLVSENGGEFHRIGDPDLIYGQFLKKETEALPFQTKEGEAALVANVIIGFAEAEDLKIQKGWLVIPAFDPVEYQHHDYFESPIYRVKLSTGQTEIAESGKIFDLDASLIRKVRFGNGNTGAMAETEDQTVIEQVVQSLNGFKYDSVQWHEGGGGWHHSVSLVFENGNERTYLVEPDSLQVGGPWHSRYVYTSGSKPLKTLSKIITDAVGK